MQKSSREERNFTIDTFAESRGFTASELTRWGISLDGNNVRIPILRAEGTWGNRIHRPFGRPKYQPEIEGLGNHLYNPHGLGPNSEQVWLAEGEFDTLSLVTVGAPAVGVLGASGFRREWALLFRGARVIVAFDPDSESEEQAQRVAKIMQLFPNVSRFDPLKVGGHSDLNDWFRADRNSFKAAVAAWG